MIVACRSSPASASLSWLSASASAARPCTRSARPRNAEPVVRRAQRALGGSRVAFEQVDEPGKEVGLEELLRDAQLFDHPPRRRDHAPRRLGASAERLEHRLAAERDGLDPRRALGDAQHTDDVEAAPTRARHRARTPECSDRRSGEHRVRSPPVVCPAGGGQRLVEGRLAGADLAEPREREGVDQVPLRLAGGVTRRPELVGRGRDRVGRRAERLRIGEHGELAGEAGVPGTQAIGVGNEPRELGDRPGAGADVARLEQRLAPVERQVGARRIGLVEPIERTSEQACRRRQVVAPERSPPRRREVARRAVAERAPALVERAQLGEVPVRLLEVPADRLVVLDRPLDPALEPVGDAFVQLRPRALQHPAVRRIADEAVVEPERRLAQEPGGIGLDQLAPPERLDPRVEVPLRFPRQQVRHRRARELPPDDRRPLQHQPILRPQPLDARRQKRVDRRRHLEGGEIDPGGPPVPLPLEGAIVDQHAHQLAQEKRIALAGREHPPGHRRGQRVGADHVGGEPGRGHGVEATEHHHVGRELPGRHERRARVAEIGARRGEEEERHPRAPLHQVLEQVEQQRLGPLEVVKHEHHRLGRPEAGEQAAHDEERLLGRRRRPGQQRADPSRDAAAVGLAARHRGIDRPSEVVAAAAGADAEDGAQRLGERREGRTACRLAVGDEHGRPVEASGELIEQARLADPRGTEDDRQARGRRRPRGVVDRPEPPELLLAADEGHRRRAGGPLERHDSVCRHRLRPAPQRHAAERRQRDQGADEPPRRLPDYHVAVLRRVLEAGRDVDRIADDVVGGRFHDDLARVDRDPEPDAALLAGERAEGLLHGQGGAHGAHRIVLGDARQPERGHDAVAEELHDRAAVSLDGRVQRPVVPAHQAAYGLGVEPLVQRRRADQVGEDDGNDLAGLEAVSPAPFDAARNRGGVGDEGGAAGATELRRWRDVNAAAPASTHQHCTAFLAEAIGGRTLVATRLAIHCHRRGAAPSSQHLAVSRLFMSRRCPRCAPGKPRVPPVRLDARTRYVYTESCSSGIPGRRHAISRSTG